MRSFVALWALMLFAAAASADTITASLTFTNRTVGGDAITVSGNTRTFTNDTTASPSTLILTNDAPGSATNYYNHTGLNPYGSGIVTRMTSPTNVQVIGDATLVVTITGTFATVTRTTNTSTARFTFLGPYSSLATSNQTNQASEVIRGFDYATNAIGTNARPMANFSPKTNAPLTTPTITGGSASNFALTNVTWISGTMGPMTNGQLFGTKMTNVTGEIRNFYGSNAVIESLTVTNFSSPGTGMGTLQVGEGAVADGDFSVVLGPNADATVDSSASVVIGQSAQSTNSGGTAVGFNALTGGAFASAFGSTAISWWDYSTAIGYGAYTSNANEIAIGTPSESVWVRGAFHSAKTAFVPKLQATNVFATNGVVATNSTLSGGTNYANRFMGTNRWDGDFSADSWTYSSLVDRPGANTSSGITIGTNYIVELSGGTAMCDLHSLPSARTGTELEVRVSGAVTNWIINNSGSEATSALRFKTGTGADVPMTNQPAYFKVRKTSSAWEVMWHSN